MPCAESPDNGERLAQDRVVVGIDGSAGSEVAIRWALRQVKTFGSVQPVAAWSIPWWALTDAGTQTSEVTLGEPSRRVADSDFASKVADAANGALQKFACQDLHQAKITHGLAGPSLVQASMGATMLVVGTRGRGAVSESILGSVSSYCAALSVVPVAIVPGSAPTETRLSRAIVGVDGSLASVRALAWAMDRLDSEIQIDVVHVWNSAANTSLEFTALPVDLIQANAGRLLNRTIASARDQAQTSRRSLQPRPEYGDPRTVLQRLSVGADLLVLGARGYSMVAPLLLGSVTTALIHHPFVPTIIVPTAPDLVQRGVKDSAGLSSV